MGWPGDRPPGAARRREAEGCRGVAEGCQGRPRVGAAGAKGAEGTGKAGREKRKGKRRKKKERKAQRSPHYSIIEAETSSRVAGDGRDGQQRGPRVAEGAGGGRGVAGDGRGCRRIAEGWKGTAEMRWSAEGGRDVLRKSRWGFLSHRHMLLIYLCVLSTTSAPRHRKILKKYSIKIFTLFKGIFRRR